MKVLGWYLQGDTGQNPPSWATVFTWLPSVCSSLETGEEEHDLYQRAKMSSLHFTLPCIYFLIHATWGYLQFKGANAVLTVPCLAACSTQKCFSWLPSSLFAFLFLLLFLDTLTRWHAGLSKCQSVVWQHELDHSLGFGGVERDTSGVILLQWMGV